MSHGTFVLTAAVALSGPFFPVSLVLPTPRADSRRCSISTEGAHSDCALIGPRWVATTAGAVAAAHPVGGKLRVRVGDDEFVADQIVYHPRWSGGAEFDVTLLKLNDRVPAFPVLPPPGEFPANVARIAQHAFAQRAWVSQTIGPSSLWDARGGPTRIARGSGLLTRVRLLIGTLAARTSNN